MWPRYTEVVLACWVLASPFLFGSDTKATTLWAVNLGCAVTVLTLDLLSFRWRFAHLGVVLVAFVLLGHGYLSAGYPPSPIHQSEIIVSLLWMMFGIIPSHASRPAASWERFSAEHGEMP